MILLSTIFLLISSYFALTNVIYIFLFISLDLGKKTIVHILVIALVQKLLWNYYNYVKEVSGKGSF